MNSSSASGASNYIKAYKIWQSRINALEISQEDCEAFHLEKEWEKEDLETFHNIGRIVSHRETSSGDMGYFCKWMGLNYDHCTWELHKEVDLIAKEQILAYRKHEAEAKFPYKSVSYYRHSRPEFKRLHKDPEYIAITGG